MRPHSSSFFTRRVQRLSLLFWDWEGAAHGRCGVARSAKSFWQEYKKQNTAKRPPWAPAFVCMDPGKRTWKTRVFACAFEFACMQRGGVLDETCAETCPRTHMEVPHGRRRRGSRNAGAKPNVVTKKGAHYKLLN